MNVNLIYFLIPFLILSTAIILNFKFRWITKKDMDDANGYPFGSVSACILLAFIFWPVVLIVLIIFSVYELLPIIIKKLVPDDEK